MKIFKSFNSEVVDLLKDGAVGIVPTDTVYGIVARLESKQGVEKIYAVKGRPLNQPVGTIIIADPNHIEEYVKASDLLTAQTYWPGPTSVIIETSEALAHAHRGIGSLPFRIPDNDRIKTFLHRTGPLATTSANFWDQPPATNLEEALKTFRSSVDFYVDGGDLSHKKASKIIKIHEDGTVEILRS